MQYLYLRLHRVGAVCGRGHPEIPVGRISLLGSRRDGNDHRGFRRRHARHPDQRRTAYFPQRYLCTGLCGRGTVLLDRVTTQPACEYGANHIGHFSRSLPHPRRQVPLESAHTAQLRRDAKRLNKPGEFLRPGS